MNQNNIIFNFSEKDSLKVGLYIEKTVESKVTAFEKHGKTLKEGSSSDSSLLEKQKKGKEIVDEKPKIKPEMNTGNESPNKLNYLTSPDASPNKRMSKRENKLKITLAKDRTSPLKNEMKEFNFAEDLGKRIKKEKNFYEDLPEAGCLSKEKKII